MTDDLVKRLRDSFVYDQQHYAPDPLVAEAADRIEALTAENERLRAALDEVWKQATTMRNASRLVSPYPTDHAKRRIWVRSLYHEGKRLLELLKPARAALGDTQ
jgi:hypothetical protein